MLKRLIYLAFGVLLFAAVVAVGLIGFIPKAMGYVPTTVLTGSMNPTFKPGDMIWIKPVASSPETSVASGQVVTYRPTSGGDETITHRVIGKNTGTETTYITRGDYFGSDDSSDEQILAEQIVGVVHSPTQALGVDSIIHLDAIPKAGYALAWIDGLPGVLTFLPVGILTVAVVFYVLTFPAKAKDQGDPGRH